MRLGTPAFTATGWEGRFYLPDLPSRDYLSYCAWHIDTVEEKDTFHRSRSPGTVRGWYEKTPKGFVFAAKVLEKITHEKVLADADSQFMEFLAIMDA